jgi:hypothetical protein
MYLLWVILLVFVGTIDSNRKIEHRCYLCRPEPCTRWAQVVTYRNINGCNLNDDIINESCESYKKYTENYGKPAPLRLDPDYYYLVPKPWREYHHKFGYIDYKTRDLYRHTKPTGDTSPYECEAEVREILRKREL